MLRTEQLQAKMTLYKDSVTDAGNGFAAMSMTRAKKEILNMTNEEIRLDLEQQRLEKAAAAELANTANIIKKSGLFDKVDRIYGDLTIGEVSTTPPEGGDMGGGMSAEPTSGTEAPTPPEPPAGGETGVAPETATESLSDKDLDKLLLERKDILKKEYEYKKEKYSNNYVNKLIESLNREEKENKIKVIMSGKEEVSNLNDRYNNEINGMMDNINELLNK